MINLYLSYITFTNSIWQIILLPQSIAKAKGAGWHQRQTCKHINYYRPRTLTSL
jgi:hypothetical protein